MKIRVLSIGKTNIDFVEQGLQEYLKRLKHYTKLEWIELPDVKQVDRSNTSELKTRESERFLEQLKPTDHLILLDEKGKHRSSEEMANWIKDHQLYQQSDLVFIIGGAYGFSETLYAKANGKLSLSKMTFNHQMVRMIFAEQLYRAFTIIKGEPYHHA